MRRGGQTVLWVLSAAIVAVLCIPAAYLVVRATDATRDAWGTFLGARTAALLGKTLGLAAVVTLLAALVALPLAWVTSSLKLRGRRVWSVLLCLPLAIPSFVSGYVLLAAFGTGGLAARWFGWTPEVYGFSGATFALVLTTYPYLYLAFRAALLEGDPSQLEAARSLGATASGAFFRVTLPRLVHAFRSGGLLVSFYVLSDFGAVSLLQYDTFSRAIYMQLEGAFDRSLAALWSLGLMALAIAVLWLSVLGEKRGGHARTGLGASRRARRVVLPAGMHALVLMGLALTVAAGVGLPVGVTLHWLTEAAALEGSAAALFEPAWNSILAAGLAAAIAVACALPLGILTARGRGSLTTWLERASYASYCLPPVVVALSLVSFGVRALPLLYGTLAMLVLAHVVRFTPQAMGPVKGSFLQLSPRLPEAAKSLGHGRASVAARVTLPLVRPGMIAGGALVFLTAMKELPATLLLGPIGFSTLATRVWSATAEGQFAAGALPSLALMLVSSISVGFALRHESAEETGATG